MRDMRSAAELIQRVADEYGEQVSFPVARKILGLARNTLVARARKNGGTLCETVGAKWQEGPFRVYMRVDENKRWRVWVKKAR